MPALAQEIDYWLWDANQQPAYQQCAANFMEENPDIQINITQQGLGRLLGRYYHTVSSRAPRRTCSPTTWLATLEFAANEQLVDIQPLIERDSVDTGIYLEGLAELWTRDGARYGLPKDWDTIAVAYNQDMLDAAGVTVEELNNATWNPEDGGHLRRDYRPAFPLTRTATTVFRPTLTRTTWCSSATCRPTVPTLTDKRSGVPLPPRRGWKFIDDLYATEYHYDDPRFIATIEWYKGLIDKGYAPSYEEVSSLGKKCPLFPPGQGALMTDGSWNIGTNRNSSEFPVGFASVPAGPEGKKSMFNGLADSIWVGTDNQDAAWEVGQVPGLCRRVRTLSARTRSCSRLSLRRSRSPKLLTMRKG